MAKLIKNIVLSILLAKTCLGCSSNQFSFQGNSCLNCEAFIAFCVSCSSGQYSAVINGSFETPVIDNGENDQMFSSILGWYLYPADGSEFNLYDDIYQDAHEGSQMFEVEKRYEYIYQDLTTDSGQIYEISLYYTARKKRSESEMQARISWGSNIDTVSQQGSSNSNWQHYTATVTASASTTRLKLESIGTEEGKGVFFDSVSYKNLPTCTLCETGYGVNSDNTCKRCSDYHTRCVECNSACTLCYDGYYQSSGSCLNCPFPCSKCSDSSTCTECINNLVLSGNSCGCSSGMYLNTDQCDSCSSQYVNCRECNSSSCTICSDGFFLNGNTCADCPGACTKCSSLSECSECKNNVILISGSCGCNTGNYLYTASYTCEPCSDYHHDCQECDTGCTLCSDGFFVESETCSDCPATCKRCSSFSECLECKNNLVLTSGSCGCRIGSYLDTAHYTCEPCTDYHTSCLACDTSCVLCSSGFFVSGNGCADCPGTCTVCSSLSSCSDCKNNLVLSDGSCGCNTGTYLDSVDYNCNPCSDYHPSCIACDIDCTTCSNGTYVEGGSCLDCPSSCTICSSSSNCSGCVDGFYLNGTMCEECPSSCSLCSSLTDCSHCKDGFYLDETMCEECPSSCSLCSNLTDCSHCKDGFYLNGTMCEECPNSCSLCSSLTDCSDCKDGFYLNATMCEICPSGCSKCSNLSTCTECLLQFTLISAVCISCPPECEICSDSSTCLGCLEGYFVRQGECEECPSTCTRCSSSDNCSQCKESFVLRNGKCETCSSSCRTCSDFLDCLLCQDGFFLDGATCKACDGSCRKCSDQNTCLECSEGFYLEDERCSNCSHTCKMCLSGEECTECKSSFSLVRGECVCLEGDYFKEEGCRSCSEIDENCEVCDSFSLCTKCSEGFEAKEGTCNIEIVDSDNDEISETDQEEESMLLNSSAEESGNYSVSAGLSLSALLSVISGNPYALWNFLNISMFIHFAPLMKTNMSPNMKDFCQSFRSNFLGVIPNFGELLKLKKENYKEPPREFKEYEIESTSFLLNAGGILSVFLLSLFQLPLLCFVCLFCCRLRIKMILKEFRWNFFIRSWIQMYLELLVMAFLSVSALDQLAFSLEEIISIFIMIIGFLTPFLQVYFIIKYKEEIKCGNYERFSSLFAEFKVEKGPLCVIYYPLFFLRRLNFSLGVFIFEERPLVQISLNAFFSMLIIVYTLLFQPYKRKFEAAMSVGSEFFVFIIFTICGLCIVDNSNTYVKSLEYSLILTVGAYFCMICILSFLNFVIKCKKRKRSRIIDQTVAQNYTISTSTPVFALKHKRIGEEFIFQGIGKSLDNSEII